MSYEYDVALSFAGEDRKFVEDCAEILRSLNIGIDGDLSQLKVKDFLEEMKKVAAES